MRPVVVGLDLSLAATGFAGPDGTKLVRSTGHKDDTLAQRATRLHDLAGDIITTARTTIPDPVLVVIEAPSLGQGRQGDTHDRSGLWWVVVLSLRQIGLTVLEVSPATLKTFATGKGNAKKPDIRMEVFKRYGVDIVDDNETDAFVLRALGLYMLGAPLVDLPQTHTRALAKLALPVAVPA